MDPEDQSQQFDLTIEDAEDLLRSLAPTDHLLGDPRSSKRGFSRSGDGALPDPAFNVAAAQYIFKLRRHRSHFFPAGIFAEPAWDMLLMLYATTDRRPVRVKELALVCQASFTTALRWQAKLASQGWIVRTPHPADSRSTEVQLTDMARDALDAFFASLRGRTSAARVP